MILSEEAKLLKEDIRQVPAQGVRVVVSTTAKRSAERVFILLHVNATRVGRSADGRKFTLLIDRKLAIVGTRGGEEPTLAMLTEHPAMVELLYNHFFQWCRDA